MKVQALRLGYYGDQRRREGEIFDITSEKQFSAKWMRKIQETSPDSIETIAASPAVKASKKPSKLTDSVN